MPVNADDIKELRGVWKEMLDSSNKKAVTTAQAVAEVQVSSAVRSINDRMDKQQLCLDNTTRSLAKIIEGQNDLMQLLRGNEKDYGQIGLVKKVNLMWNWGLAGYLAMLIVSLLISFRESLVKLLGVS